MEVLQRSFKTRKIQEYFSSKFIYNNKNISIKSATEADAPLLLYWWNDGEIMSHAGFPLGAQTTLEKVKNSISKNTESKQLLIIYCVY